MDRNTIVGIAVIFLLFIAWQQVTAPTKAQIAEQKRIQDSIALAEFEADSLAQIALTNDQVATPSPVVESVPDSVQDLQLAASFGVFANAAKGTAQEIVLENELTKATISTKGGAIQSILLKDHYKVYRKDDETLQDTSEVLSLLSDQKNKFEYFLPVANLPAGGVSTADLYYQVERPNKSTVVLKADLGAGRYLAHEYAILPNSYKIDYKLTTKGINTLLSAQDDIQLTWINYLEKIEKNPRIEKMNSALHYKKVGERPGHTSFSGNDEESSKGNPVKWVAASNQFFTTAFITQDQPFSSVELESQTLKDEEEELKRMVSTIAIPFDRGASQSSFEMQIFSGPNEFDRLNSMDMDLEDVIPYGWNIFGTINRWIIRPVFQWLSTFIGNKGIVILFLTLIVKLAVYPLTYRMLYSQSKMQALKPEIEKIKTRLKDDSQKIQMETMKLYREFGANPLGSCFPMVLQLPIWFALYRFFPAAIDFRQEGFLWASDLSSYDEFIRLPFSIPLGFGSHISLFTVLWAITTLIYTYYNSRHMDFSSQPAMKYMQYGMPIFFLGFFNSYSSGLTAYLFFSNVINITQTIVTKEFIINKEKIKAEMEAYRKKPKKKGGFQERLQKALEEQRKIQDQQQKGKKKNGKK